MTYIDILKQIIEDPILSQEVEEFMTREYDGGGYGPLDKLGECIALFDWDNGRVVPMIEQDWFQEMMDEGGWR